jgi:cellobiose-specific phosphotransferase system component IIB
MDEWVLDYQTDITAVTGQAVPPVCFISQMLTGETGTIPAIPLAQLASSISNADIIMVGPKYAYPYYDTSHMLAEGYVKMAELEARAERFALAGKKWQPLRPLSAVASGSTITVTFNNVVNGTVDTESPIGNLVLDYDTVSDPGNAGFSVEGSTITGVTLGANGRSVVLTLSAPPTIGSDVIYALQDDLDFPAADRGRRGNVRDSDMRDTSRFDGEYLYNWSVAFTVLLT